MISIQLSKALDTRTFGGKAVQLGAAIRAGLPVPDGYCLDAELVAAVVQKEKSALGQVEMVCARLKGPLAVRSSAVGEDSAAASFAGQHATLLNVSGFEAVTEAIGEVWRSGRTESALEYRRRLGADETVSISVVVQRLIAADVSGVLFTCNPMTGRDERVIEAGWGLGEGIVQGLMIPDRYRIARGGAVLERIAGAKDVAVRICPDGATRQEPVQSMLIRQLCLSDAKLRSLDELATRCDEVYGQGPHDIEWAIEGEDLFLLQRRPITVLAARGLPS